MGAEQRNRYGPWALIAGASEGVGAEFARQLAERGFHLILVARRQARLDALVADLGDYDVQCTTHVIDLALPGAAARMREATGTRQVGLLILNAGADAANSKFLDAPSEIWTSLLTQNVITVMEACHEFAGPMRKRKKGGIILIGSGACYAGISGLAVYGGSKAFGFIFAEALSAELKDDGVDVLDYVIGQTDTPAYRSYLAKKALGVPTTLADPAEVVRFGLSRLGYGPSADWHSRNETPPASRAPLTRMRESILASGRDQAALGSSS